MNLQRSLDLHLESKNNENKSNLVFVSLCFWEGMSQVFLEFPWALSSPGIRSLTLPFAETLELLLSQHSLEKLCDFAYFTSEGKLLECNNSTSQLHPLQRIVVCLKLAGGKGGYGSQLKALGSKMAAKKSTNFDECRDLQGNRLRTVQQQQQVTEHLQREPQIQKAKRKKTLKKLARILSKPSSEATPQAVEHVEDPIVDTIRESVALKGACSLPEEKKEISLYWEEE